MNMITYRKAEINDCLPIAKLKGIVWNTTYKGIYTDEALANYDVLKNKIIFEQIVNNPEIEVYVAVNIEQIVGFMTCGKPYKPFEDFQQEIGMLYILKEYQRQGIGKTFFNIARQQAALKGHNKFLVAVNKKNYEAQKFYIEMGGKMIYIDESQMRFSYSL
ncbi:MAG: GNAT family N-acetyltransferase [Lachnospiraceae bacterium]|nr:GNAT family N-acetyltransferase [Lachnospiraceae bacterium]